MSVKRASNPASAEPQTALIFGAALGLMCLIWFFGIALRVSLTNDNATVALGGISRVLTNGFPDFRDTSILIVLACAAYLTCLWALEGRSRLSFRRWMELDLEYIDNWSLALDWKVLLKTIPVVLLGRGAS